MQALLRFTANRIPKQCFAAISSPIAIKYVLIAAGLAVALIAVGQGLGSTLH